MRIFKLAQIEVKVSLTFSEVSLVTDYFLVSIVILRIHLCDHTISTIKIMLWVINCISLTG